MNGTIIYLFGFAGCGKLTIAKAIQLKLDCILVDNHRINNVIFSLIDPDGIAKAIKELRVPAVAGAASPNADEATRVALNDAQIEAWFQLERAREREQERESSDLLLVGIGAVGALIQGFLSN